MSVDVFGRQLQKNKPTRGLPGIGFNLLPDGNFDIENKKLCNVADCTEDHEAVNFKILNNKCEHLNKKLDETILLLREDFVKLKEKLDKLKDHVDLNTNLIDTNTINIELLNPPVIVPGEP